MKMMVLLCSIALLVVGCFALDRCSRTRRAENDAEAIAYSLWQLIFYHDQLDRYEP